MRLREVGVPGVPLLAGILPAPIGRNERNVKTPVQQFRFGLGLVVPITGLPRPRIAGRRLVWNDHDAPPLTLGRSANRKAFFFGSLHAQGQRTARRPRWNARRGRFVFAAGSRWRSWRLPYA